MLALQSVASAKDQHKFGNFIKILISKEIYSFGILDRTLYI